jgi:hypothetical protein
LSIALCLCNEIRRIFEITLRLPRASWVRHEGSTKYLDYSVFSAQSAAGQPKVRVSKIFFVSTFFVVEIVQHEGLCIGLKAALTAG